MSKSGANMWFFYVLTPTCTSCHSGMHSFIISTSERAPKSVCFVNVDFEKCFAPRRCTLFEHLSFQMRSECGVSYTSVQDFNFQKCSELDVLLFLLTCNYASCEKCMHFFRQLNFHRFSACDVLFSIFICKRALRRNGVPAFILHLARWLRTRCFGEPTCRLSGATFFFKYTAFRDFPTFWRT